MAAAVEKFASGRGVFSTAEWLVARAKESLKHDDRHEAKSWLLTAKTLYPRNFHVQHEAYNIERSAKNVKEAAALFHEMFEQFTSESLLWEDIFHIIDALESDKLDSQGMFLKEMFSCFPQDVQREMLLQSSGRCKDCIEKCCIMLLLLRRFPDAIPKNGITLTEILTDAESTEYPSNPINPYRRLLVCDVLPHLLSSDSVIIDVIPAGQENQKRKTGIPLKQMYKWLELSIQFYSFCATTTHHTQETQLMSPLASTSAHSNDIREVVAFVHEGRGPWRSLYDIFCQIAKKCGWTEIIKVQEQLDPLMHRSIKDRWLCISDIHHRLKKAAKHGTAERVNNEAQEKAGVFYATIIIFIQAVWEYCKSVNKLDTASNPCLTSGSPLVLIEEVGALSNDSWSGGSTTDASSAPKKKKKKTGAGPPSPTKDEPRTKQTTTVVVSKSCGNVSSSLPDEFVVSVDSWQILNTHADYKNEFTRVLREWHINQWLWMDSFKVDRLVYKAKYKKVVEFLKEQKSFIESDPSVPHEGPVLESLISANPGLTLNKTHYRVVMIRIRGNLQLSCCYFYLNDYKSACTEALDALKIFSTLPTPNVSEGKTLKRGTSVLQGSGGRDIISTGHTQQGTQGRFLQLIPCTETEILSYSVRLLITCIKQRIAHESRAGDLFGHLIVLLQYDWPKEEDTFYELLDKVRAHGGFTYRCFFNYVNNIDMLEELAHLNNEGVLKLELLPKATSTPSRTRTVTRGVNKGAKEDFRAAMERQVACSDENIEMMLPNFFEEERDSILS